MLTRFLFIIMIILWFLVPCAKIDKFHQAPEHSCDDILDGFLLSRTISEHEISRIEGSGSLMVRMMDGPHLRVLLFAINWDSFINASISVPYFDQNSSEPKTCQTPSSIALYSLGWYNFERVTVVPILYKVLE